MTAIALPQAPQILIKDAWMPDPLAAALRAYNPKTHLGALIKDILKYCPDKEAGLELLDRLSAVLVGETSLSLVVFRSPDSRFWRGDRVEDYGVVGFKVVTDAFVAAVVDALDSAGFADIGNFKYHGIGTGVTAEAQTQTALVTELTTEYTGNVRATGTGSQPSANIYRNTGTNTLDSGTPALREHAVFSASAAGTMLDRTLFAAINLDGTVGDGLQSQYSLTLTAGG